MKMEVSRDRGEHSIKLLKFIKGKTRDEAFVILGFDHFRVPTGLWNTFSSFSEESTIHSLNYIGRKNIGWIER